MHKRRATKFQHFVSSILSRSTGQARTFIGFCLLAASSASAATEQAMTTDQIISRVEQQLPGKVIAVSYLKPQNVYQLRFIKPSAEILVLLVEPKTAHILQQKKALTEHASDWESVRGEKNPLNTKGHFRKFNFRDESKEVPHGEPQFTRQ
jgi:hypothetical protein